MDIKFRKFAQKLVVLFLFTRRKLKMEIWGIGKLGKQCKVPLSAERRQNKHNENGMF